MTDSTLKLMYPTRMVLCDITSMRELYFRTVAVPSLLLHFSLEGFHWTRISRFQVLTKTELWTAVR